MKERKREDWKWKRSVAVCWSTWSNRSNSSNGHSDGGGGGGSNGSFSGRSAIIHHEGVSLPLRPETTSYDILRAATASFLPLPLSILSSPPFFFISLCFSSLVPPFFPHHFLRTMPEREFRANRNEFYEEVEKNNKREKENLITICKVFFFLNFILYISIKYRDKHDR